MQTVAKEGEQDYLANIGEMGRTHCLNKPFSDTYCGMNLTSIGTIMSLLPPAPARILDLGCGGGWTSIFLARHGYEVVGQDIAADMIELARENAGLYRVGDHLQFICGDFESLDFQDHFDAAIFFDSLHHAEDEALAIRSAYRALKPGGILITHEPGEGHAIHPQSIQAMELYGVTERDMPPQLIIARGKEAGFVDARILPMPEELFSIFYKRRTYPKHLLSKRRFNISRRVLRLLFKPDPAKGAIVIQTK
ncbi:class I SAM-dependent methyltransferase [Sphingobium yanoikuyae]|uniref:class I SAM-dependent methyltransferase n=1 Tax=Sphingobium yanoikuyae TaxID=13690 RepID=UPI0028B24A26|nr:class I SAM-dependent methyltransferase [Sphingobium yanoikuyae]